MSRRSSRTAARAAESRIAKVVEDASEDSDGSNFDTSGAPSRSSSEDGASSGPASDNEYIQPAKSNKSNKSSKSKTKVTSPPAPKGPVVATVAMTPPPGPEENPASRKELTNDSLKSLLRGFRLTDLQALFIYVNKNKAGRKTELLERACDLVDNTTGDVKNRVSEKIQELSNAMYRSISSAPSVNPYSANYRPSTQSSTTTTTPAYHPNNSTSSTNADTNSSSTQSSTSTRPSDTVSSMPPLNPYPSYPSTPYYSSQNT